MLLDNAPSHPSEEFFDSIDEQITVFYLPPNVTSLIQPMNQGIISSLKRKYREFYLEELLNTEIFNSAGVSKFLSNWNVLDCLNTLFIAREKVTVNTLKNSWKNLFDVPESSAEDENNYLS